MDECSSLSGSGSFCRGKGFFEQNLLNPQRWKGTSQFSQKCEENLGNGLESETAGTAVLWVDTSRVCSGTGRATAAAVSASPPPPAAPWAAGSREGKGSSLPGASRGTVPGCQFCPAGERWARGPCLRAAVPAHPTAPAASAAGAPRVWEREWLQGCPQGTPQPSPAPGHGQSWPSHPWDP